MVMQKPKGMQMPVPGQNPMDMMGAGMGDLMKDMMSEDMAMIQIPEDRSVMSKFPRNDPNLDVSKWVTIWPNNIDSTKSIAKGRKVPISEAVCPPPEVGLEATGLNYFTGPSTNDIMEALNELSFRFAVEPYKMYPRDASSHWTNPGRLKVEIFSERSGACINPEVDSRNDLFKVVAREVNKLESRKVRLEVDRRKAVKKEEERMTKAEEEAKNATALAAKGAPKSKEAGGGKKKKGKKGRG